jgi:hypothetical protein
VAAQAQFGLVVCGGGPAGLGPLVAAARLGALEGLLDRGVLLVEPGVPGPGSLARYGGLRANSLGGAFLECLDELTGPAFAGLKQARETVALDRWARTRPPLAVVAAYLARLGEAFVSVLRAHPACEAPAGTRAARVDETGDGVSVLIEGAGERRVRADRAILAMGGRPPAAYRDTVVVPGVRLSAYRTKLCHAADLLDVRYGLPWRLVGAIRQSGSVAIVGSSHSAWSVVELLRQDPRFLGGPAVRLSVLHRSPIPLFHPSAQEAREAGYCFDPVRDVCPRSGRVHRFGGLRGEPRRLAATAMGLADGPAPADLVRVEPDSARSRETVEQVLQEAGAVVVATGYQARLPLLHREDGTALVAAASESGTAVNRAGHLLDTDGRAHPRLLAYGLGAGQGASPDVGGEPGFRRRADGVWLYQHDVGRLVLDELSAAPGVAETVDAGVARR